MVVNQGLEAGLGAGEVTGLAGAARMATGEGEGDTRGEGGLTPAGWATGPGAGLVAGADGGPLAVVGVGGTLHAPHGPETAAKAWAKALVVALATAVATAKALALAVPPAKETNFLSR